MLTNLEYALMAGVSYRSTRDGKNRFPLPMGWKEIPGTHRNIDASGFEAVSFHSASNPNEIVISFAGTYPKDVDGDQAANAGLAAGAGLGVSQLLQAAEYYLQVRALNSDAHITLTGHSLGGGLAALIGVFFNEAAVTFDQAPFRASANNDMRERLLAHLAGLGYTDGEAITALKNFTSSEAAEGVGASDVPGIRGEEKITMIRVDGEFLDTAPWTVFKRIGSTTNEILNSATGLTGFDLHSHALLTAFLQSQQTAAEDKALNDVTVKLPDLLRMIFDKNLYAFDTDTEDENFLERLLKHEAGVRDPETGTTTLVPDRMVTRFTSDLWKLAQDGGLTLHDGSTGNPADPDNPDPNEVSKALTAFAMQFYYEDTVKAADETKELFTEISGGIQFDLADVSKEISADLEAGKAANLRDAKGYALYFSNYLKEAAFSIEEQAAIAAILPKLRDWYVQAGDGGMEADDTLNRGAFLLGGARSDSLGGGDKADLLVGNDGADTLEGGLGRDTLIGGNGDDTYVFNPNDGYDTILDSDGTGAIKFGDVEIRGSATAFLQPDKWLQLSPDTWVDRQNDITYIRSIVDDETRLTIRKGGNTIVINGWEEDDLGIQLGEGAMPVLPDLPVTTLTRTGDKKPLDLDPARDGIQTGRDEYGNVITSDEPDPDRADVLYDGWGNERLRGLGGNDVLIGRRIGDDILEGGTGNDWLRGGRGNDALMGGADKDVLRGEAGDDTLYGRGVRSAEDAILAGATQARGDASQNNLLSGGDGDDNLIGAASDDMLSGGSGRDLIIGMGGNDTIVGDEDITLANLNWSVVRSNSGITSWTLYGAELSLDDNPEPGTSSDIIYGGAGDDWVYSQYGDDFVDAGEGHDRVFAGPGNDHLYGGGGDDILSGDDNPTSEAPGVFGDDVLDGGKGRDILIGGAGEDMLLGGSGDDQLYGYAGKDIVIGGGNNDTLDGGADDDTLQGGGGTDHLYGGSGNDTLIGGSGSDTMEGGTDDDTYLLSGGGSDVIADNEGNNIVFLNGTGQTISANSSGDLVLTNPDGTTATLKGALLGAQTILQWEDGRTASVQELAASTTASLNLKGSDGNESVFGSGVADQLRGNDGADILYGAGGDDVLIGGNGNDRLEGEVGDDWLRGGVGSDILLGGKGKDTLEGGAGSDVYRIGINGGPDTIYDEAGEDSIVFDAGIALSDLSLSFSASGYRISYGQEGDSVGVGSSWAQRFNKLVFADGTYVLSSDLLSVSTPPLIRGTDADDILVNAAPNMLFDGGGGNDVLVGGGEGDTYFLGDGGDKDVLVDLGGVDTIMFGSDIYPEDVEFEFSDTADGLPAFKVRLVGTSDWLAIKDGELGVIERFVFDDGTVMSFEELAALQGWVPPAWTEPGGALDDRLVLGGPYGDTLSDAAGAGGVYMPGGGDDILDMNETDEPCFYILNEGDGHDVLNTYAGTTNETLLLGEGISPESIRLEITERTVSNYNPFTQQYETRVYRDLTIQYGSMGDTLYILDGAGSRQIERMTFANGASLSLDFLGGLPAGMTFGLNPDDLEMPAPPATDSRPPVYWNGSQEEDVYLARDQLSLMDLPPLPQQDIAYGRNGNDIIATLSGNDILGGQGGNDLLIGGSDFDELRGGAGNDLLIGGQGTDLIHTGGGADVIVFNRGDGLDAVYGDTGTNNTISLGGGLRYEDLRFRRSDNDLILETGAGEGLVLKDWYEPSVNYRNVSTLQLTLDASVLDPASADPLLAGGVQRFDFRQLAAAFDSALANDSMLTSWSLTNALTDFHLGGSDTEALGGDLAYQYGRYGKLDNVGVTAAQSILSDAAFGAGAQTLRPLADLGEGALRLS